jgi:hypothetical protein
VKRENDSGGARLLLARGGPSSRQEFVAAIVRPEIDEADENIGQIGLGLDAVQFTGLYQRAHRTDKEELLKAAAVVVSTDKEKAPAGTSGLK